MSKRTLQFVLLMLAMLSFVAGFFGIAPEKWTNGAGLLFLVSQALIGERAERQQPRPPGGGGAQPQSGEST